MVSVEDITTAVNRYLELVASGTADEIAALYAEDATVEDPVGGGEVHIGRQAIHGFYKNIENIPRATELHALRRRSCSPSPLVAMVAKCVSSRLT